jgi:predicted transposase/invertase (TIGR01784 family)
VGAEETIGGKAHAPKYDEGYKDILSNKDAFFHFLKKYIAAPWVAGISPGDIEKIDKSFVTSEYRHIDSDLIYKLKMNGSDAYFYVLLELQSSVDFTMPFRLLKYMVALLDEIFKNADQNARARKDFKLPAIVPIILHNGDAAWTAAPTYRDYTENGDIFGDNIINFSYLLFDLRRTDEETILSTRKLLDIIFALDKNRINKKDFDAVTERLRKIVRELTEDDFSSLSKWAKYVIFKGKVSPDFEKTFKESITKGEGIMKHALEVWADEWREEGKLEAKLEAAKNLLANGVDVDTVAKSLGLTVDEVLRLKT